MDEAAFGRLLAAVDQDEAALAAISARTGSRYSNGWLKRKLAMARQSAVREAMVGYARMFTSSDISKAAAGLKLPVLVMTGQYDIPIYSDAWCAITSEPFIPISASSNARRPAIIPCWKRR